MLGMKEGARSIWRYIGFTYQGTYFRDIGDPGGTDMELASGTRFVELAHDSELFADSLCGGQIVLVWISIRN